VQAQAQGDAHGAVVQGRGDRGGRKGVRVGAGGSQHSHRPSVSEGSGSGGGRGGIGHRAGAAVGYSHNSPYSHRPSVSECIRQYESEMLSRGADKVQKSRDAAYYLHSSAALAVGNVTRAKAAEDAAKVLE
jgi:hypothetical protein